MELSKAKERLKDLIDTSEKGAINCPDDKELFMTDKEALETVLKALDNSISKDKVIKKIEEYRDFFISSPEEYRKNHCRVAEVVLKELLGEG